MSQPLPPAPAKLLLSVITADKALMPALMARLTLQWGPVDQQSPWYNFDFTDYYQREMGAPLFRQMLSFNQLIAQEQLAAIKVATNALEADFSLQGRRRLNLDPGYLLRERLVLATGKNFTHRIYLQQGIYADLTLIYQKGAFRSLPWTYPDYASPPLLDFLVQVRQKYIADVTVLNHLSPSNQTIGDPSCSAV